MRLIIIGGSFNPPHNGHLQIAEFSKKALNANRVTFLVTPQNPFKKGNKTLSLNTRVELLKQIATKKWMNVSDFEKKFHTTESINTIRYLTQLYRGSKIYFVMGSDNLLHFHKWKCFEEILDNVSVIFVNRGGINLHKTVRQAKISRNKYFIIYKKTQKISSTEIRLNCIL